MFPLMHTVWLGEKYHHSHFTSMISGGFFPRIASSPNRDRSILMFVFSFRFMQHCLPNCFTICDTRRNYYYTYVHIHKDKCACTGIHKRIYSPVNPGCPDPMQPGFYKPVNPEFSSMNQRHCSDKGVNLTDHEICWFQYML